MLTYRLTPLSGEWRFKNVFMRTTLHRACNFDTFIK